MRHLVNVVLIEMHEIAMSKKNAAKTPEETCNAVRTRNHPIVPRKPFVTGVGNRSIDLPTPSFPRSTLQTPVSIVLDTISARMVGWMRSDLPRLFINKAAF